MNIFKAVSGWFGNSTHQGKGEQTGSPATSAHDNAPSIGIDSALQVSTVWACVTLLVETIASLPMGVYRVSSDGERVVDKESRLQRKKIAVIWETQDSLIVKNGLEPGENLCITYVPFAANNAKVNLVSVPLKDKLNRYNEKGSGNYP